LGTTSRSPFDREGAHALAPDQHDLPLSEDEVLPEMPIHLLPPQPERRPVVAEGLEVQVLEEGLVVADCCPRAEHDARGSKFAPSSGMRLFVGYSFILVSTLSALPACDGNGDGSLSPEAVSAIPPGTGRGSSLSGEYRVTRVTTSCEGRCAATVSGFLATVCDVGEIVSGEATFTQTDGTLEAFAPDEIPALYRGGVALDGTYDLGGYATQNGATIEITVRSEGTLTTSSLTGTARSHTWGEIDDATLDCVGRYDVSGTRD
jgi:hypothetical protein